MKIRWISRYIYNGHYKDVLQVLDEINNKWIDVPRIVEEKNMEIFIND